MISIFNGHLFFQRFALTSSLHGHQAGATEAMQLLDSWHTKVPERRGGGGQVVKGWR